MTFHILTIFPNIFASFLKETLLAKAIEKGIIKIEVHDIRDFTEDKHKTVDDTPYGGGPGMVIKVEPIYRALKYMKKKHKLNKANSKTFLLSAKGKLYKQETAKKFSEIKNLILICGRYEGVDERVAKNLCDGEISIGEYVLSGGEIPAMAIIESVSRLIPGVIGNKESLKEESFENGSFGKETLRSGYLRNGSSKNQPLKNKFSENKPLKNKRLKKNSSKKEAIKEYPQYTKPEKFVPDQDDDLVFPADKKKKSWAVPEILLSGNHKKIKKWRKNKTI